VVWSPSGFGIRILWMQAIKLQVLSAIRLYLSSTFFWEIRINSSQRLARSQRSWWDQNTRNLSLVNAVYWNEMFCCRVQ
jgi:hypothetical protein